MAFDAFLKIDGVEGESTDSKQAGSIELLSYSFGNSNQGAGGGGGGGGGAGKVQFQDFHFVTHVQKSSPKLFLACANGQHFKKAVLTVRKQGSEQQDYYTVIFEDIVITQWGQAGEPNGSDATPLEETAFNFAKITQAYREQGPDGGLREPVTATWDLKKNTGR